MTKNKWHLENVSVPWRTRQQPEVSKATQQFLDQDGWNVPLVFNEGFSESSSGLIWKMEIQGGASVLPWLLEDQETVGLWKTRGRQPVQVVETGSLVSLEQVHGLGGEGGRAAVLSFLCSCSPPSLAREANGSLRLIVVLEAAGGVLSS